MRISDWSSDVCSSDLAAQNVKSKRSDAGFFPDRRIRQVRQLVDERPAVRACAADREVQRRRQSGDGIRIDRKSVVQGTSVSVSVDLGGSRLILQTKSEYVLYDMLPVDKYTTINNQIDTTRSVN